jgi:hypothetical protein
MRKMTIAEMEEADAFADVWNEMQKLEDQSGQSDSVSDCFK